MNFLDKDFLANPVESINLIIREMKRTGQNTTFEAVRTFLYPLYLDIDASKGTDYAAAFAERTGMSKDEQEDLRYKWSEKKEAAEAKSKALAADPQWTGKEVGDWAICLQAKDPNEINVPEDARVYKAERRRMMVSDFLKAKFLYVPGNTYGFVCKAEDFNFDSYKFTGTLRVLF